MIIAHGGSTCPCQHSSALGVLEFDLNSASNSTSRRSCSLLYSSASASFPGTLLGRGKETCNSGWELMALTVAQIYSYRVEIDVLKTVLRSWTEAPPR